jgi:hypothetical protein
MRKLNHDNDCLGDFGCTCGTSIIGPVKHKGKSRFHFCVWVVIESKTIDKAESKLKKIKKAIKRPGVTVKDGF